MPSWKDIFHSSGDARRRIDFGDFAGGHIGDWVDDKIIQVSKGTFGDTFYVKMVKHQYFELKNMDRREPLFKFHYPFLPPEIAINEAHGGVEHRWLGYLAAAFLLDKGKQVLSEQFRNGSRIDILSSDNEFYIECGDTNPAPMLEHLSENCIYFCVFPFCTFEDNFFYIFERGENWAGVELIFEKRREELKRAFSGNRLYKKADKSSSEPQKQKKMTAILPKQLGLWENLE